MFRIIYILIISFLLLGCNKRDDSGWSVFRIDSGDHSSSNSLEWTRKDIVTFDVVFDSTAIYTTVDPINQYDVNKLFGVSDGGLHVRNSARFGWRWLNGKLELMAFTHLNGLFHFEKVCDLEIGKQYTCSVSLGDDYTFTCIDGSNPVIVHMERWHNVSGSRYYLWPYFGGDETAPHDITIKIKY
jgi:hypothetical protein